MALFKKKLFKLFIISTVAAVLPYATGASVFAATSAADLDSQIKKQEQEYQKIQKRISLTNKKIKETSKKERDVSSQIEELSQKITVTQQKVNVVTLHIKKVQRNIVKLSNEIADTNKGIREAQELLGKRLVSIYKYGGVTEFTLLLSSQGAEDALSNTYLLGRIAEQDQALINDLTAQKKKLSETQQELKEQQARLQSRGKELKQQHTELRSASDERNLLLSKVRRDKALYMAEQEELLRASKELQSTVKRLLAEKRRLNQARNPGKKETVYYRGGRLAWPVHGNITSSFGTRIHPVFKTKITHTGIDISAPKGAPVRAADAGEILYTGWMRGYGQVVIIDHGGNLTTVYAHLSGIDCVEDAKVQRGTVIGRVGSTGIATGNHLHFEVRANGDAVNPMRYLQ
ncbi:MAG: peptidoglycan DD-metalloendopeptidase family protein [Synergistaceae bacterium]|nr:peptidoglycan DD-metalloendopeptidase family protein [Synergistaceae bacterium]